MEQGMNYLNKYQKGNTLASICIYIYLLGWWLYMTYLSYLDSVLKICGQNGAKWWCNGKKASTNWTKFQIPWCIRWLKHLWVPDPLSAPTSWPLPWCSDLGKNISPNASRNRRWLKIAQRSTVWIEQNHVDKGITGPACHFLRLANNCSTGSWNIVSLFCLYSPFISDCLILIIYTVCTVYLFVCLLHCTFLHYSFQNKSRVLHLGIQHQSECTVRLSSWTSTKTAKRRSSWEWHSAFSSVNAWWLGNCKATESPKVSIIFNMPTESDQLDPKIWIRDIPNVYMCVYTVYSL